VAQSIAQLHAEGLAHNNVRPESLLFNGHRETGEVRAMLVGLVEPSFEPEAREEDVRHLADMIANLIRQPRIDALRPETRPALTSLREGLAATATGQGLAPSISAIIDALASGLAIIDSNFNVIRTHGGDIYAYADVLIRHALYRRLYG